MNRDKIGSIVRKLRREHDLSQADVAEHTGLTQSYVSAVELNNTEVVTSKLVTMLDLMGYVLVVKPRSETTKEDIVIKKLK